MLSTILVGLVLCAVLWKYLRGWRDPLDALPGPSQVPVLGCSLHFIGVTMKDLFTMMREFNKKYGDRYLIRIFNRKILHLNSPDDVEIIMSHTRNISKSFAYTLLEPWLGTGLLLSTGTKWHKRRRILTPTFHFNILKNFLLIIEENTRDLVELLRRSGKEKIDVQQLVSNFTLNTICETAMGTRLNSDKSAATIEYKSAILKIGYLLLNRLTKFWLHNDFLYSISASGKEFQVQLQIVKSFADNVILERKKNRVNEKDVLENEYLDLGTKKRVAMLDLLLDAERKGEIDLEGIREEVYTFMFEGHDTTAMALTFALMLLADHEHVQDKIHEECQSIFEGDPRAPTMADLADMKYLEAVIKEVLRLYPSVPFVARTVGEDFMLGDLKVKKGTEVAVHIYDLHRRRELFEDPDEFKPERFLRRGQTHPYSFIPFSAGSRNCIGQRFAMQEMKCVLSGITRWLKVFPCERGGRPPLLADMVLRPADPVYVTFMPRDPA